MKDLKKRPIPTLSAGVLIASLLLIWPQATLQALPQAEAETWPDTEVVVKGRLAASPAIWRVQKGESQVIILGILPVFPKSEGWNTKRIENALRNARGLITPPTSNPGFVDMIGMMSKKALPGKQLLKNVLSPQMNARYEATARRAGVNIRDFARDKPVWAGARLRREVLERRGLSSDEPLATVVRLAGRLGVPVRSAAKYKIGPIFKDINSMDAAASEACLGYALDDIDFDLDRAPKAALAWAQGDIRTVRANYQGSALMKCLAGSDQAAQLNDRSAADAVTAITGAFSKPGKTVAVLPLAVLLRRGGVLERLRAQGYAVSNPAE